MVTFILCNFYTTLTLCMTLNCALHYSNYVNVGQLVILASYQHITKNHIIIFHRPRKPYHISCRNEVMPIWLLSISLPSWV